MPWLARAIATVGFLGHLRTAPGTAGSLVGLIGGLLAHHQPAWLGWLLLLVGFVIGVAVATQVERELGTVDPSCVVIDECWGMWAVTSAVPLISEVAWLAVIAFILFRAFDIAKPPPLERLGRYAGGWGIMLDDLGAAVYTCLVLRLILAIGTW
jgi:phosphatidylglycerophosphatase A